MYIMTVHEMFMRFIGNQYLAVLMSVREITFL